jgi:ATP-dependent DNA helicase RecQ
MILAGYITETLTRYCIDTCMDEQKFSGLILSPPASGKTQFIKNYLKEGFARVVYVSPLLSLGREVLNDFSKQFNVLFYEGDGLFQISTFDLIIIIPERAHHNFWNCLESKSSKDTIFVFDEFHLFYFWGDSFRQTLLEFYYDAMARDYSALFLSATMSEEQLSRWKTEQQYNRDCYVLENGNNILINEPIFTIKPQTSLIMEKCLRYEIAKLKQHECLLVFLPYRKQVKSYAAYYRHTYPKLRILSCISGEVHEFMMEMEKDRPQIIFSTSVLSHGVNLPTIKRVFLYERDLSQAMWIQMVARGGRKGEKFGVYVKNNLIEKKLLSKAKDTFLLLKILLLSYLKSIWSHT